MPFDKSNRQERRNSDLEIEPSKKRPEPPRRSPRTFDREASPGKNVRFPTDLIMGPFDPRRRSESPMRPALFRRIPSNDSPSMQLQSENDQANETHGPGKKSHSNLHHNIGPSKAGPAKNKTSKQTIGKRNSGVHKPPQPGRTARVRKRRSAAKKAPGVVGQVASKETAAAEKTMADTQSDHEHVKVCEQLNQLKQEIRDFAENFPAVRQQDILQTLLVESNENLVRYIGCLAMGNRTGVAGWRRLLDDTTSRHALVFGILGRALKEYVFSQLYFGTDPEFAAKLRQKERSQFQQDGFFRTRETADAILKRETADKLLKIDPKESIATISQAIAKLTVQLEQMLLPFWKQGGTSQTWASTKRRDRLAEIVKRAALLSRKMRADGDTVYYWPPTFKDEEFEPERMECYNLWGMMNESPYDKKTVHGVDRPILREGLEDKSEAIVKVVCFPGCVAYRQGGGDLAQRELAEENSRPDDGPPDVKKRRKQVAARLGEADGPTGDEGYRSKVLCKSVVLLEWSKQRLLTKEAGTSTHMDAIKSGSRKYEQDERGFVELYELYLQRKDSEGQAQRAPSLMASLTRALSPYAGE